MASTALADIQAVPEIFMAYVDQERENVNRLVNSGAVVQDPAMTAFMAGGGLTLGLPSYLPTEDDTENLSDSDIGAGDAVPDKLVTAREIVTRFERNGSWASADLTATLGGDDPLQAAARMVSQYQVTKRQNLLTNMLNGLMFSGGVLAGHVNDVSAGVTPDISADNIIDTTAIFGDEQFLNGSLVMHSSKYRALQKLNLIDFTPTNVQNVGFGVYIGFTVLVDDRVPVVAGTPTKYWTYLLAPGSISEGNGSAKVPVEVERQALAAKGGGNEILVVRDAYSLRVNGTSWVGTIADDTASNAELANVASWAKIYADKKIRVAALVTI